MHILIIHQAFASLDEAGGTRHYELARFLVKRGHRVTIIASPVSYITGQSIHPKTTWVIKQNPEEAITILRSYTYAALHRSFFHRILSFFSFMVSSFIVGLGVKNIDLVWGTSPPIFQGVTAWLLARLKRAPCLFEVRDLWPAFAIEIGVLRNKLLIGASKWLEKFLYSHADQVIVNSPGYIEHVRQRGARHVELIPNGVDPEMFTPQANGQDIIEKYHLEGKFIALYAGAHGISNDLDVVLETAHILRDQVSIVFLLVGDGKEKPGLESKAGLLNLSNLIFLPPVPKNEMEHILAAANVCIAILKPLDLYKTTYPNKVFDYMAAGKPVILAIDGVIRQVVEDAHAGIFVQPGDANKLADAVKKLNNDPSSVIKMGTAGRDYVKKHFNRIELADKLNALLVDTQAKNGRKNINR